MKVLQNKKNLFFALITLSILSTSAQTIIFTENVSASPPYRPTTIDGRVWQVESGSSSVSDNHLFPVSGGNVTLTYRTTVSTTAANNGQGNPIALFWVNADMNPSWGSLGDWSSLMNPPPTSGPNLDDDTNEGCLVGRDHQNSQPPIRRYNCQRMGATVYGVRQLSSGNHATYVHNASVELRIGPNTSTSERTICATMHVGTFAPRGMSNLGDRTYSVNQIKSLIKYQSDNYNQPGIEALDQPTYSVSENFCFRVAGNQEPVARWELNPGTCRYRVIARDPDNNDAFVHYRMLRKNSGAGYSEQVPEIPQQLVAGNNSNGTGWIRPPRDFVAGTYYIVKVKDANTGEWHNARPEGEGADTDNSRVNLRSPPICNEPMGLGICAEEVRFQIPSDGTVLVRVFALREGWDTNNPMLEASSDMVYNSRHGQTEQISLKDDPGLASLLSNEGFWVSVVPDGQSIDPRPGGRGTDSGLNSSYRSVRMGPCFSVTCDSITIERNTPLSADVGWPANAVKANSDYKAVVTLTNHTRNAVTGDYEGVPAFLDQPGTSRPLSVIATAGSGFPAYKTMSYFDARETKEVDIELTAPNALGTVSLGGYPGFANGNNFRIGADCPPATVNIYQPYDFQGGASTVLYDDSENPKGARFSTTMTQDGTSGKVGIRSGNITRAFYRKVDGVITPLPFNGSDARGNSSPHVNLGSIGTGGVEPAFSDDYVFTTGEAQVGHRYCALIRLDRGHGWRGPDTAGINEYLSNQPEIYDGCAAPGSPAPAVVNQPYFRVYGNDVAAGGGFSSTSCGATQSHILAFMRPLDEQVPPNPARPDHSNKSGSGGQLGTMALGEIQGFTSASLRTSAPTIPNGLTFANVGQTISQVSISPSLGGGMAGDGWCASDYFKETQYPDNDLTKKTPSTATTANLSEFNVLAKDKQQTIIRPEGADRLHFVGDNVATFNYHHTVYVEGDVFIENNIMYKSSGWANIGEIPSFALIVKGNIYIDRGVSQLDGLYVAQPIADGSKGRIYTCSRAAGPVIDATGLFTECGAAGGVPKLTVNGAFIASRVILNRTTSSTKFSTYQEYADVSNAAEVFNFSPEMYLAPPVFSPRATTTGGDYDYISSLPPIL